jgi:hypothetical protein
MQISTCLSAFLLVSMALWVCYIISRIQITFIFFVYDYNLIIVVQGHRKSRGRDRMVVGFITTYVINANHL